MQQEDLSCIESEQPLVTFFRYVRVANQRKRRRIEANLIDDVDMTEVEQPQTETTAELTTSTDITCTKETMLACIKDRFYVVGGNIRLLFRKCSLQELKQLVQQSVDRLKPADITAFSELNIDRQSTPSLCYSIKLVPGDLLRKGVSHYLNVIFP